MDWVVVIPKGITTNYYGFVPKGTTTNQRDYWELSLHPNQSPATGGCRGESGRVRAAIPSPLMDQPPLIVTIRHPDWRAIVVTNPLQQRTIFAIQPYHKLFSVNPLLKTPLQEALKFPIISY